MLRLLIVVRFVTLVGVPRSPRPPRPARVGRRLRLRRPCPVALSGAGRAVAWGRQACGAHAAATFQGREPPRAAAQEVTERGAEVEAHRRSRRPRRRGRWLAPLRALLERVVQPPPAAHSRGSTHVRRRSATQPRTARRHAGLCPPGSGAHLRCPHAHLRCPHARLTLPARAPKPTCAPLRPPRTPTPLPRLRAPLG